MRRLEPLPAETRRPLLLAAGPAQAVGLVEIGARVRFRRRRCPTTGGRN